MPLPRRDRSEERVQLNFYRAAANFETDCEDEESDSEQCETCSERRCPNDKALVPLQGRKAEFRAHSSDGWNASGAHCGNSCSSDGDTETDEE